MRMITDKQQIAREILVRRLCCARHRLPAQSTLEILMAWTVTGCPLITQSHVWSHDCTMLEAIWVSLSRPRALKNEVEEWWLRYAKNVAIFPSFSCFTSILLFLNHPAFLEISAVHNESCTTLGHPQGKSEEWYSQDADTVWKGQYGMRGV